MGMQQEKMYSCWLDYHLNKGKDSFRYEAEVTYSKNNFRRNRNEAFGGRKSR